MKTLFIFLVGFAETIDLPPEQRGYYPEDYYMNFETSSGMMKAGIDIAFFDAKSLACAITTYDPTNVFGAFPEHAID